MSKSAGEVAWVVKAEDLVGVVLKPLIMSMPKPIGIMGIPIGPWIHCMPFGVIPYGDI